MDISKQIIDQRIQGIIKENLDFFIHPLLFNPLLRPNSTKYQVSLFISHSSSILTLKASFMLDRV